MNSSLLARFIPEARDLIQASATGLLKLEKCPHDKEAINEVFRAVHTLKGSSGLFDALALTRLVHAAEDLLDAVRAAKLDLDSELVDMLLDSLDQASGLIDELETSERLPAQSQLKTQGLVTGLRARLAKQHVESVDVANGLPPGAAADTPDWVASFSEAERLTALVRISQGQKILAVQYKPEEQCFYKGEDPLNSVLQLPELLGLNISARQPWPDVAQLDPYRSNLVFTFLTAASRSETEHHFRYVVEQLEIFEIEGASLIELEGTTSSDPVIVEFVHQARRLCAVQDYAGLRQAATVLVGLVSPTLQAASVARAALAATSGARVNDTGIAEIIDRIALAVDGQDAAGVMPTAVIANLFTDTSDQVVLKAMAQRVLAGQRNVLSRPYEDARAASVGSVLKNMIARLHLVSERPLFDEAYVEAQQQQSAEPLLALIRRLELHLSGGSDIKAATVRTRQEGPGSEAGEPSGEVKGEPRQSAKVLKVDQAKVDLLMNSIGELVVSKNSLPFLAKRAEEIYGSREMAREIKDKYAVVDRLAQEMQSAIVQVRMLPVSEVFDRFPRLVRDMARKLGKRVDLRIEGEETAADKTIIEALGDPLLHIVRNAIDHGIESPQTREAAGKPAEATIRLCAFQEADQVVITVGDDGGGIDPSKIRSAAVAKGVVSADQASQLSDQEAINLIFRAGFSTAEVVSDISGRGVGMDVVLSTIARLAGRVTVSSQLGRGTDVRMSLPLSMAVTRIMMVESHGQLYGVPMDIIVETVRVPVDKIKTIKSAETFVLRNSIIPLIRMGGLLGRPSQPKSDGEDEAVLVCRVNSSNVGLVIDNFRERMDVILKPLSGILAEIKGFSGTALLGDGRVLLVLDLKELF